MIEGMVKRVFMGEVRHKLDVQVLDRLRKSEFWVDQQTCSPDRMTNRK